MKPQSSPYIEEERRIYSLYTLQSRAIVAATDGLKPAGRRALWVARNGQKVKTATLAGATMPIHPHAECSGSIQTLAAPYSNNIPLFDGDGAFGTLLKPNAYGAARYTSVSTSKFTDDVLFRDIEIIPMQENYDGSIMEPTHFLPLVPISLLNPSEGIAVGFASNILPRRLEDVINAQIAHLKGQSKIQPMSPYFYPTESQSVSEVPTNNGVGFVFEGEYTLKDASTIVITKLPYGAVHANVIKKLDALYDAGDIQDYTDKSKNTINIEVKMKRGAAKAATRAQLLKMFGLSERHVENFNVLDFTGESVWHTTPIELVKQFTDWRLGWYVKRYERLRDILKLDLSRLYDIRISIKNKIGDKIKSIGTRSDLKAWLEKVGVTNLDYIADLGIYRFTDEENTKNEMKIQEAEKLLREYEDIIASDQKRVDIYITELKGILSAYKAGKYK